MPASLNLRPLLSRHFCIGGAIAATMSFLTLSALAQRGPGLPPPVAIAGTQLLKLTSKLIPDQEYALQVHLPRRYSDSTRTFPVVYVLDGQWDFALVQALYGQQYYDGFVPDLIIVGITWGGTDPDVEWLRARDFTPSPSDALAQAGGADRFLEVLNWEIIPFVESTYRTSPADRTLMGSSFGGLFVLHAMFRDTQHFGRYIATSPALAWNGREILREEQSYADSSRRLPARLFMALGEYEDVEGFERFVAILRSRTYDGLELDARVLENTGHSGSKGEGFARGLQHAFSRPSLALDTTVLNKYRGLYQLNPGMTVRIFIDGGRLMGQAPDGAIARLHAESDKDFYVKGQYLFIRFRKDQEGQATGFQLERWGAEQFARKVE